ncbi:antibiotic biosynthesis monooxygenase [Sporolactobacillus shoreicorticis]|uniref:Antibiotic biosynthesis monooxygenase family protein n=1 Tax=Sporolactobacillus shoreicorticis TaxID=1923877 RepID=A0ABW5S1A0_9BACL|nr:antibiotic biosynthesis monooxygenase [Sporolactobacillus shoreicorticis]MCO7125424.1 antibiotic biosynthesis monooxygenase [Sporolactobacillus shoreicorticis]
MSFAKTPAPPYYAVIFTSKRTEIEEKEYGITADQMVTLASKQQGFLSVESARDEQGIGITVSYWSSLDAIKQWKRNAEHQMAQKKGKGDWYESFITRISKVEKDYSFTR